MLLTSKFLLARDVCIAIMEMIDHRENHGNYSSSYIVFSQIHKCINYHQHFPWYHHIAFFSESVTFEHLRKTDPQLKVKLQRLETQKRAALDHEASRSTSGALVLMHSRRIIFHRYWNLWRYFAFLCLIHAGICLHIQYPVHTCTYTFLLAGLCESYRCQEGD